MVETKETNTGFKFDLKATNGEVIAVSEGYKAKENCANGIESVKKNAPEAEVVEQEAVHSKRAAIEANVIKISAPGSHRNVGSWLFVTIFRKSLDIERKMCGLFANCG